MSYLPTGLRQAPRLEETTRTALPENRYGGFYHASSQNNASPEGGSRAFLTVLILVSHDTGAELPREKNPKRPVMRHDEYLKLLEVAHRIDPLLKLALVVAEGTGRRVSAWRNLLWEDIDFQNGTIRWRAENDKKGYEQVVPMSDAVRDALLAQRKVRRAIGNTPVFPALKDPMKPCSRHLLDDWLRRAYRKAGIEPQPGGLWHPIRRKWVTERKGSPVKDVAAAGGWRDEQTMLRSYQHADAETVRQVVLHPTQRLANR